MENDIEQQIAADTSEPLPGKHVIRNMLLIVIAVTIVLLIAFFAWTQYDDGNRISDEFSTQIAMLSELERNYTDSQTRIVELENSILAYRYELLYQDQKVPGSRGRYDFTEEKPIDSIKLNNDFDGDTIPDDIDPHPYGESTRFQRTARWSYGGKLHEMNYTIDLDWYMYYAEKPRARVKEHHITPYHPMIIEISDKLQEMYLKEGYSSQSEFVLAFVQYLPYAEDEQTKGRAYPRYPVETLYDNIGDCEDMTYLAASILLNQEIDIVLIDIPGHIVPGVACANCEGVSYGYDGRDYYYIEPTAPGYSLGEIPEEYTAYNSPSTLIRGLNYIY